MAAAGPKRRSLKVKPTETGRNKPAGLKVPGSGPRATAEPTGDRVQQDGGGLCSEGEEGTNTSRV